MADTSLMTQPSAIEAEKKSLKGRIGGFFDEVQKEMKKVTWPTREQLQEATIVTLVLTVVCSLFIFGVDKIFEILIRFVYPV